MPALIRIATTSALGRIHGAKSRTKGEVLAKDARLPVMKVGDWTVEPALNQISSAGKTVKLEPKAMSVLVYLADRPGQVVSREALLSAVWPGVVVGDDSLTQVVIKLRKALGDVPERPAYIQTISKRGLSPGRAGGPVGARSPPAGEVGLGILHVETRSRHAIAGAGVAAMLLAASRNLVDRASAQPAPPGSGTRSRASKPPALRNRRSPSGRSKRWATTRRRYCLPGHDGGPA